MIVFSLGNMSETDMLIIVHIRYRKQHNKGIQGRLLGTLFSEVSHGEFLQHLTGDDYMDN